MSLTSSEMTPADIAAVTGNSSNGGFGYGGFSEWIIILFLFAMFNGGWGGNGYGNNGGFGGMYPWLNNSNQINDGFQNQLLNDNITSIREGVYGINNQLYSGFAGVNANIANSFAQAEIAENGRQMANMNQMFSLQSQLAQCCCDNRLATCQTQNIVQNEGNQTRFADAQNTRDIIESNNQGFQKVLDKLCQLELDGLKQDNANLRTQLNMANLAASQTAQTAELRQSNANQLNNLVSELRSCPIPCQPVYGNQAIFSCNGGNYAGCGCGA